MFNDAPSYRVGEASRARPKGLPRLPNIYNLEMYQYGTPGIIGLLCSSGVGIPCEPLLILFGS